MTKHPPRCEATGKQRHPSKARALGAALGAASRSGIALSTYRCPHCRGWHLTKQPQFGPPQTPA